MLTFWSIRRLALVCGAVIATVLAGTGLAILLLGLRDGDAVLMLELLAASTAISLIAGGLLLLLGSNRRWNRLSVRFAAAQVVGVLVALVNIVLTAAAMFISSHDLGLLIFLLGYSLAIALLFSSLVSASLGSSLQAIRDGAVQMAAGDLATRVPVPPERELADLGEAFNVMAERLDIAFSRQRELEAARQGLIAAVSHDLRTPLASMRVMIEAINDGVVQDEETVARYIGAIEREIVCLGRLIDDLFELARLDAGDIRLQREPSPIGALIGETLDAMRAQATRQHVSLEACVTPDVPLVLIDPDRIQRVLYNLVQNAIRHTPADGSIIVEAIDRESEIQVNVRDSGEGIAASDLPHIFDRFYRGDRARTRERDETGAGLGLAIARRLVETHGGRIWVAQPASGGSIFSFTLPKHPQLG